MRDPMRAVRREVQARGLERPASVAEKKTPPAKGRLEGNRRARLSSPFPYAGSNQFRFEGCALRPARPDQRSSAPATPNDVPASPRTWGKMHRRGVGCKSGEAARGKDG